MLSHLRFHRRGQSNPTSPNPEQPSAAAPWDPSRPQQSPFIQDAAPSPDTRSPSATTNSSLPPVLPPITRVASTSSGSESPLDLPTIDSKAIQETYTQRSEPTPPVPVRSPNNSQSGFVGGVALRKQLDERQLQQLQKLQQQQRQHEQQLLQQQMAAQSPDSAGTTVIDHGGHESHFSRSKPAPPPPINTAPPTRPPPQPTKSSKSSFFATPTDLQNQHLSPTTQSQPPAQNYAATGRRPAGTRLSSEPTHVRMSSHAGDAPKGRKGLPFLKNPMSTLLMRRKTSQNAPDLSPLPLGGNRLAEPSYDPRIRGTRVHDFSAPRSRRSVPASDQSTPPVASAVKPQPPIYEEKLDLGKTSSRESAAPSFQHGRNASNASDSGRSGSVSASQTVAASSSVASTKARSSLNLDSKPLPDVPPKDVTATSSRSASVVSKKPSISASIFSKTMPSTRTNRSRHVSLSAQDTLSSVPRHMKSTSSRFSFDMVGAAKQEKLLEERHRQRELERKTSDPPNPNRDSRFDDFDDDFDYDAMMDDDGMEEPIPMSNDFDDDYPYEEDFDAAGTDPLGLDGEEDFDAGGTDPLGLDSVPEVEIEADDDAELDPDNDQENFAGFVFQRSNPVSALTSPHSAGLAATPRDAEGRVIGFAMSRDTPDLKPSLTPDLYHEHVPEPDTTESMSEHATEGLGIVDQEHQHEPELDYAQQDQSQQEQAHLQNQQELPAGMPPPPPLPPPLPKKDDLYFDNGLLDELDFAGEGDGSTFDESIFDLDDTDKYGRPLPGVFAKFQAARAAANAPTAQDTTAEGTTSQDTADNDTSGQEGAPRSSKRVSDSTSRHSAHSNVSQSTAHTSLSVDMPAPSAEESKRQSDVLGPDEASSAMTSSFSNAEQGKMEAYQAALAAAAFEAAANGKFRRDSSPPPSEILSPGDESSHSLPPQDDYEFDDYDDNGFRDDLDDNDFDYDDFIAEANASALANDQDGWYGQEFGFYSAPIEGGRHSRDNSTGSEEKPFEYANGGFFGPSGVSRSKSGRMISREPNLTPITERSEYSNRNSIMSLGIPHGIGSGPSSLQSPGLAQLAMMADGDESMSLTALMKLRSRAWGGSQASLVSSREGSPRSERADGASSPWGPAPSANILGIQNGHARKNSAFSVKSRDMDSDAGSASGSPTLTMSVPTIGSPAPLLPPLNQTSPAGVVSSPHFTHSSSFEPVMESDEGGELSISNSISHSGLWMKSPDSAVHPNLVPRTDPTPQRRPGMGHKHKGSADSISYIKEEDEGETRWVLERRFTADSGEVEVQREVVGKGHI
ncbi:hypothetical protein CkaCkLH20_06594 [Colletotrichum karsti]|uniref:AGC-kinase C-terminal domain-containing protein n=1 Tax=Colletotrichum karsti TaxID=1095194 RepID=A0A9P6LJY2_9PEZI|nr:uncharacterized protein CkaCkLH20_06594 [Colletotrichum karsti]KAF9876148.1 hypothetical protein CkaCkLH20_06594 [Colletotrichum karsti]